MARSLLFTQCLQNDFVKPIGRYDALPNQLHIGFAEASRLMGEDPSEGPVAHVIRWAYGQDGHELRIVHIRDWHDANDPAQKAHLAQFGAHCIRETEGAGFAFETPDTNSDIEIVDAITLNDFMDTRLPDVLDPLGTQAMRVGIMGVWTEAKVLFLAYDLRTRYPAFEIGVCSALTASSSRAGHFAALDQLRSLLGVTVYESVGEFIEFLGGSKAAIPLRGTHADTPKIGLAGDEDRTLQDTDATLVRHLFRDCREVNLTALDGGFSGNLVLGSESIDVMGHSQVPHVVKIGPGPLIGRERASFERIESVLGNNAPRITEFADLGERGAIKYRYASMGGGFSTTFQKMYCGDASLETVADVLETVFREQLGRFYAAASLEKCNLLDYYGFDPRWADAVRKDVDAVSGPGDDTGRTLVEFYERGLETLPSHWVDYCYFSYVHGDLNGANVILDAKENVWLIDFFHTHRGHILKDLIKLENDLLYIFTPVAPHELAQATAMTDALLEVEDLAKPLDEEPPETVNTPALQRAWKTVRILRSFYADLVREDRDPLQLIIGLLRYSVHTLSFDESEETQKRWALHASARYATEVTRRIRRQASLRIDWIEGVEGARIGMTILPGRKDYGRNLDDDIAAIQRAHVTRVVCLVPPDELSYYGVPDLLEAYSRAGFDVKYVPILDQRVTTRTEIADVVDWVQSAIADSEPVLLHCVGGLGRSGTVAGCVLQERGFDAETAIRMVRGTRGARAIESADQERFVLEWKR